MGELLNVGFTLDPRRRWTRSGSGRRAGGKGLPRQHPVGAAGRL